MDALHDPVEFVIDFLGRPADVSGVLGHLKTRSGDTTGIDSLTRGEEDAILLEITDSIRLATHVRNLAAAPAAISDKLLGVSLAELVLESARKGDVHRNAPSLLARCEDSLARELRGHILNLVTVRGAHVKHVVDHLRGNSLRNMADTVRSGNRDDDGTKLAGLCGGTPSDISESGEGDLLADDVLAGLLEKVLSEIQSAETCGLRTKDGTAPSGALASQDTSVVLTGEFLVHTIQETDLTATDTHITGRDVLVRTDAAPKLKHEGLAETHDLSV